MEDFKNVNKHPPMLKFARLINGGSAIGLGIFAALFIAWTIALVVYYAIKGADARKFHSLL